jgi:hypothetical protein
LAAAGNHDTAVASHGLDARGVLLPRDPTAAPAHLRDPSFVNDFVTAKEKPIRGEQLHRHPARQDTRCAQQKKRRVSRNRFGTRVEENEKKTDADGAAEDGGNNPCAAAQPATNDDFLSCSE